MRIKLLLLFTFVTALQIFAQGKKVSLHKQKLFMAESLISGMYVDSIPEPELVEFAIVKMLEKLDPHSTYLSAENAQKQKAQMDGKFEGIGMKFNMPSDIVTVIDVVKGGPAEKSGLLVGDKILKADTTHVSGVKMDNEHIVSLFRGPKGSNVSLTVTRNNQSSPFVINVERGNVPVRSVDAFYLIKPDVGYIKLSRFAASTGKEFKEALTSLQNQKMKNLIIDLQGNGGGYLQAVLEIANELLSKDELIVYTEGRTTKRRDYHAKEQGAFRKGNLVILVDERSASCSEILSGAVQDWDRGVVIGRRTFGKGLVQRPMELPDKSQLRLTVSRYYTPSGRCIQKPYSMPDMSDTADNSGKSEYGKDLRNRFKNGELTDADRIQFDDSLKVYTRKLNRPVYGGGGVIPDVFVPLDTQNVTIIRDLTMKGVVAKIAKSYISEQGDRLKNQYRSFEQFDKKFDLGEKLSGQLRSELSTLNTGSENSEVLEAELKTHIKAFIANAQWGKERYIQVMNTLNNSIEKALDILKSRNYENLLSIK